MAAERRWQYRREDLLRLSCWTMSPSRAPDGGTGTIAWRDGPTKPITAEVCWMAKTVEGRRCIMLLFSMLEASHQRLLVMQPDAIAAGPRVRWWWTCPGCAKRTGTLFIIPPAGEVLCRQCGSVTYESRQRVHPARSYRRVGKTTPPGMRWAFIERTWTSRLYRRADRIAREDFRWECAFWRMRLVAEALAAVKRIDRLAERLRSSTRR